MGWKNSLILAVLFFVAVGLFGFIFYGDGGLALVRKKTLERDRIVEANRKKEEENTERVRTIRRLRLDGPYVEKVAREEFGLVGNNEMVFQFEKGRTGRPVWPDERAADEARKAEEARKAARENAAGHGAAPGHAAKAETAKAETAKKPAEKPAAKNPGEAAKKDSSRKETAKRDAEKKPERKEAAKKPEKKPEKKDAGKKPVKKEAQKPQAGKKKEKKAVSDPKKHG